MKEEGFKFFLLKTQTEMAFFFSMLYLLLYSNDIPMITDTNDGFDSQSADIVYSRNVLEFVTVANEYGKFIEQVSHLPKKEFVDKAHKLLAFLYLKASMLPNMDNLFEGSSEKFVTEQDWEWVKQQIENKLVSHDIFVDIADPLYPDSDNTTSLSLSECFADIYQDVKDFTTAYNIGTVESMNDSLWECKQNFQNYWGERLLAILHNFHFLVYGINDLADEMPSASAREKESFAPENWFTNEILKSPDDE